MNYTMMTDLYELTMAQSYFNEGKKDQIAYFDAFFRNIPLDSGYALMGGMDEIIAYIQNLHFTEENIVYLRSTGIFTEEFLAYLKDFKFTGDIYMIEDGTPIFANEPLVTIKANVIESQIVETTLLSYLNANILYTTAAKKIVEAAYPIPVAEGGPRRAHGPEAGMMASKCALIAGCAKTSNVATGEKFGTPIGGTMAHSYVTLFDTEYEAFEAYARTYPHNIILLVDTYDTLKIGIPNAIRLARNGYNVKGIRIDSGDLAYLSKEARKMLDEAGLSHVQICLSNALDSKTIRSFKNEQSAAMDSILSGDNIAAPYGRVGCVYKLVAIEKDGVIVPKIKISGSSVKTTQPGYKKPYRFYDKETGYAQGDVLALYDEELPTDTFTFIDEKKETNRKQIVHYQIRELQVPIFKNGKLVYKNPTVMEKQAYCNEQMGTLYEEIRREIKPHSYYVNLTEKLLQLKKELICEQEAMKEKVYKLV